MSKISIRFLTTKKSARLKFRVIKQHQKMATYLRNNYINPYIAGSIGKHNILPKKQFNTSKIIWQYWGQGIENAPKIVRACIASVGRNKGDYQVIVISNETISQYIDFPDFVYDKFRNNSEFSFIQFSDLLRVSLLSVYGGVWIDSTIYLTAPIPDEILTSDFFAYQRSAKKPCDYKYWIKSNPDYFSWNKRFKVKLLNSFIVSKKTIR